MRVSTNILFGRIQTVFAKRAQIFVRGPYHIWKEGGGVQIFVSNKCFLGSKLSPLEVQNRFDFLVKEIVLGALTLKFWENLKLIATKNLEVLILGWIL